MTNTNQTRPKWLSYGGAFLLCFFLERCVCNALLPVPPLLTPLTAAAVGFWEGSETGALFGALTGMLAWSATGAARMIWLLALIGWLCGLSIHRSLGRTFPGCLLCAIGAMALVELVQMAMVFDGTNLPAVGAIALREGLVSLLFAPGVGALFSALYRRFRPSLEWT